MQRYKRGNWSVACVVSGRSSWQAKGNNATGAKVKAFPMGVGFYFFVVPNYWDSSAPAKPKRVRFQPLDVKVFLSKTQNFVQIVVGAVTWVTCWQLVTNRTCQKSKRVVTKSSTVSSV